VNSIPLAFFGILLSLARENRTGDTNNEKYEKNDRESLKMPGEKFPSRQLTRRQQSNLSTSLKIASSLIEERWFKIT
jgi:hypothetical protein